MKKRKRNTSTIVKLQRMKVDPGDVILVKSPEAIDPQSRLSLINTLSQIQPRASIIFLPHGMELEQIDEDRMGDLGWYKGKVERVRMRDVGYNPKELLERVGFNR